MRRFLVAISALAMSVSVAAPPAFAQYGGSPDDQIGDERLDEPSGKEADRDAWDPGDVGDRRQSLAEHADEAPDHDLNWEPDTDRDEDDDVDRDEDYDHDRDHDVDRDRDADDDAYDRRANWYGRDGRLYCERSDGTTGTIIGGGAGALVGRGIDTRGERGTGTVIGAVAGALLGRAIERGARCR